MSVIGEHKMNEKMDEIAVFIDELRLNGIGLDVDGNDLEVIVYDQNESISEEYVGKIRNNKSSIVKYLQSFSNDTVFAYIPKVETAVSYPLSNAQHRLWILSQFDGGSEPYNMAYSTVLKDDIAIDHFKKAVLSVINRHESLRTVFRTDETGEPRQFILGINDLNFSIDYKDVRNQKNKTASVQAYISEDVYRPFDLEKGPLLRAALLRTDEKRYVFYYNMHHIISDGWSMGVLSKDVLSFYEAYAKGEEPGLPFLSIHYKDYASWQLSQLKSPAYEVHKAYWKERLSGDLPLLDLPSGKVRPKLLTHNGLSLSTYIDAQTTDELKKFSRKHGGTLFMGLLASWNVLVYRYTGNKDTITGSPVAGRDHSDLANQIGFYVNTLALRTMLDPAMTFEQLYLSVKANTLSAYEHQTYPFDRLANDLDLTRDMSRSAVFDVLLTLQNTGENDTNTNVPQNELEIVSNNGIRQSKIDIDISFEEQGDYLSMNLIYNTDIYEKELMIQLMTHYKQILASLLDNSTESISRIPYLSKEEKQLLTVKFNDTKVDLPKNKTIASLFEDQVKKTPDAVAVVFQDKTLTYRELNEKSNQLAHYLQARYTIVPEDLIGVKLHRSEWIIICVLGILKTGAAYVPIDLEYPQKRIDYIEADTKCKVCIDQDELNDFLLKKEKYPTDSLIRDFPNTNLAYVMYTSGSTGNPKGVMVEHTSVIRLVKNTRFYDFSNKDILLSTGSISFDATTFEYWGILLNGGQLILCLQEQLINTRSLSHLIKEANVNLMWITSGLFNHLVDSDVTLFTGLKTILVGGDKLSVYHIQKLKSYFPQLTIINGYGPTENTTFSLTYTIHSIQQTIPIGRPISNSECYILDEENQLVPLGVTGEICVGGSGLSRGYLNNAQLTKEKFISHPFINGERLYKTGDLGQWYPNGNVAFIGRKDDQVKIRGYRVEPGEIEHCLLEKENITGAAVLVKENTSGEKELTAYLVSEKAETLTELRSYLEQRIPRYMIPASFVQLEEIPLTSNGKVDRKALSNLKEAGLFAGKEHVAPRNEKEKQLAKIWEEILQKKPIGIRDDFFESGGDSFKILKVCKEAFDIGIRITAKDLLTRPTIEKLDIGKQADTISLYNKENKELYELSPGQKRWWNSYVRHNYSNKKWTNIVSVKKVSKKIKIELFEKALNTLVDHYEILRTVFVQKEDLVFQRILNVSKISITRDERTVETIVIEEKNRTFDLENGPVIFCHFVQDDTIVLNMHHITIDGMSCGLIQQRLWHYYFLLVEGKSLDSLKPQLQYSHVSEYENNNYKEVIKESEEYWVKKIQSITNHNFLPVKAQKSKEPEGMSQKFILPAEINKKISDFSKKNGVSEFMTLMSIYFDTMMDFCENEEMLMGSPLNGRDQPEYAESIGMFINLTLFKMKREPAMNFIDFVRKMKIEYTESSRHQKYQIHSLAKRMNLDLREDALPFTTSYISMIQANGEEQVEHAVCKPLNMDLRYDIMLFIEVSENKKVLNFMFRRKVFSNELIERIYTQIINKSTVNL